MKSTSEKTLNQATNLQKKKKKKKKKKRLTAFQTEALLILFISYWKGDNLGWAEIQLQIGRRFELNNDVVLLTGICARSSKCHLPFIKGVLTCFQCWTFDKSVRENILTRGWYSTIKTVYFLVPLIYKQMRLIQLSLAMFCLIILQYCSFKWDMTCSRFNKRWH